MIKEEKRIVEYVIVPDGIETRGHWTLAQKENMFECSTCGSHLFYVRQEHGIVDETQDRDILIAGWKYNYALRVVGLALYCAKCGEFMEDYFRYFYPKDALVCTWDDEDLEYEEIEDLRWMIHRYNTTGNIKKEKGSYVSSEQRYVLSKIKKYEEENKIKPMDLKKNKFRKVKKKDR